MGGLLVCVGEGGYGGGQRLFVGLWVRFGIPGLKLNCGCLHIRNSAADDDYDARRKPKELAISPVCFYIVHLQIKNDALL